MNEIKRITNSDPNIIAALLSIWESSVAETHTFLTKEDIQEIKPDVEQAVQEIEYLFCYYDNEKILGFIGVEHYKIEMLFIDAAARGKGVGKKLLTYSIDNLNARLVDVNEQNIQGAGFYNHMGFRQIGRSELDEQGRPFPILHLQK